VGAKDFEKSVPGGAGSGNGDDSGRAKWFPSLISCEAEIAELREDKTRLEEQGQGFQIQLASSA
jgi:hypothetical protein